MTQPKSASAFRTISEVAALFDVQPHVLRFWESKFSQIQPVKRAAGRRFYRPDDVALIGGIRHALYEQGLTIKGVQKLLQEKGVPHMRALGQGAAEVQPMAATQPPAELKAHLDRARKNLSEALDILTKP